MSAPQGFRRWSNRQANVIVGVVGAVALVLMAVFAVVLANSQSDARGRVISRFRDRAQVASALTQALISSASVPADQARRLRGERVSTATLDRIVAGEHLVYAAVLDAQGRVIGASNGVTPAIRSRIVGSTAVRRVAGGAPVWLSDVFPGATARDNVMDLDLAFGTGKARRILVKGSHAAVLGPFLQSYLSRVPTRGGTAYVLDSHDHVVGARDRSVALGKQVAEPGLPAAVHGGARNGSYGDSSYFAAATVPGSTWKVVLTSSKSSLFTSVSGMRVWLPWIVLIAFAAMTAACLLLLRRVLGNTVALSQANSLLVGSNERLESTNALLRHAAELARSNAELEQFASIASHDLQEPLRKVQTFADQLTATEGERLSETGKDFLRRMNDAAGRMRALIDDLLAFSRVTTQGRPFGAVDLAEVAREAVADLDLRIAETGARVTVGDLPTIEADAVQMDQLVHNLLGNALKFVRDDALPEVEVRATVADGIAELTVRDNGIGFEEQYAGRIFRAFERLNGANAYPGTGIGLALCRKIVERHHGTITATGRPGEGAVFTVRLPVHQSADGPAMTSLFPEHRDEEAPHALA